MIFVDTPMPARRESEYCPAIRFSMMAATTANRLLNSADEPMTAICLMISQVGLNCLIVRRRDVFFRMYGEISRMKLMTFEMAVASEAPATPMAGIPSPPKMKMGSRMQLMMPPMPMPSMERKECPSDLRHWFSTKFAAMKGANGSEELKEAEKAIKLLGGKVYDIKSLKIEGAGERNIIIIEKISHTVTKYPRPSAQIAKNPIK